MHILNVKMSLMVKDMTNITTAVKNEVAHALSISIVIFHIGPF